MEEGVQEEMIVLNGKQISNLYVHVRVGARVWRIRKREWFALEEILNQHNERSYNRDLIQQDLKEERK